MSRIVKSVETLRIIGPGSSSDATGSPNDDGRKRSQEPKDDMNAWKKKLLLRQDGENRFQTTNEGDIA